MLFNSSLKWFSMSWKPHKAPNKGIITQVEMSLEIHCLQGGSWYPEMNGMLCWFLSEALNSRALLPTKKQTTVLESQVLPLNSTPWDLGDMYALLNSTQQSHGQSSEWMNNCRGCLDSNFQFIGERLILEGLTHLVSKWESPASQSPWDKWDGCCIECNPGHSNWMLPRGTESLLTCLYTSVDCFKDPV